MPRLLAIVGPTATGKSALAVALAPRNLTAHQGLLRLASLADDVRPAREALARMRREWPDNAELEGELLYYELLGGEPLTPRRARAEELLQTEARCVMPRAALGLARLRADDATGALAALDLAPMPFPHPAVRLLRAVALRRLGRVAEAETELAGTPEALLRAEERVLRREAAGG